ncbi:MAG TPA: helix-turn-helix domain-containing protein [Myxococcota bacterium]|nr:helix-turn-helix domain-containing protein [Myxococcota bacterium]
MSKTQAERSEATIGALERAARKLFAARGFEATSIDDIAARAGVAKGAFYHHFDSKREIFTRVLDRIQGELAALPPPPLRRGAGPLELVAEAVLRYLLAASEPDVKRILLVDGPAVVGWAKWREIDAKYFGAATRMVLAQVLGPEASERDVDALAHLVLGAVMEGALLCAAADDPTQTARDVTAALRRLLSGLTS